MFVFGGLTVKVGAYTGLEEGIRHTNHQVIHMYLLLSDLMTSQYQKYRSR